ADELCDQLTVINHGVVVAEGTPAAIKRQFGKATVIEVRLREPRDGIQGLLKDVPGVEHVELGVDGMLQTVRVHMRADVDAGPVVTTIGAERVDHMTTRSSSLEEAYLTLIRGQQTP